MAAKKMWPLALVSVTGGTLVGFGGAQALESRQTSRAWNSLEVGKSGGSFSESLVRDLPGPVQRYFYHAINHGASLYSRVSLKMAGRIKSGQNSPWMRFNASQILAPHRGFVWRARVWKGPLSLEVTDYYARGAGRMRVALLGLIPIVNATGPDLSKSALGRLIAESVLVPSSLLPQRGTTWEAEDDHHLKVTISTQGETGTLTLAISDEGQLRQVSLQRYGDQTETGEWGYVPFGMTVERENTFDGYTIPSMFRGGWWFGTDQYAESIQFTIDQAVFG